jgi:hypothetical protein
VSEFEKRLDVADDGLLLLVIEDGPDELLKVFSLELQYPRLMCMKMDEQDEYGKNADNLR